MRCHALLTFVASLGALAAAALGPAAPKTETPDAAAPKTKAPPPDPADLYAQIADAYMKGDFGELEKALQAPPRILAKLSRARQADVTYVRQALAECRPPWWQGCKAGQKTPIQQVVWGRPLNATYDPAGKNSMQLRWAGREPVLTVAWASADMDSTAPAEYGFLKGDLANLGAWYNLGQCAASVAMPTQSMPDLSESTQLRLNLYLDFRGNVTGLYYASPPARRWGLHIYLAAFMEHYGKGPMAPPRRAVASWFLTEVLASPGKYPSLKLPETLAAEAAEEKLAVDLKFKIGRNTPWTVAEDKAFREAVKVFAAANDPQVLQTCKVALPNGLTYALLAGEDAPFSPKRDAWVKAQFDKAAAK